MIPRWWIESPARRRRASIRAAIAGTPADSAAHRKRLTEKNTGGRMGFWKHALRVKTYEVYHMPRKTGYQLNDELRIEVVYDGTQFIASCVDREISLDYGTGKSAKAAVKALLCVMAENYEMEERYSEKGVLATSAMERHKRQSKILVKR